MKKCVKNTLLKLLNVSASRILSVHQPDICGITGSVGKTTTKEAIAKILSHFYPVYKSQKNYNTEIGVPLSIIGVEHPGRSLIGWTKVFLTAWKVQRKKTKYPEILVLEMGADHPGDIEYFMKFISCRIAVVTAVGSAHLEFFQDIQAIAREKRKIVEALHPDGFAVLNADDPRVFGMRKHTRAQVITYGFSENADFRASEVHIRFHEKEGFSLSCKLFLENSVIPFTVRGMLGSHQLYPLLAAIAVGRIYQIPVVDILKFLQNFSPPPGRMRLLRGIKQSWIIDDTYNSSPEACHKALQALKHAQASRTIVVFGDMLELGKYTEEKHRAIGREIQQSGADILIAVGERARDFIRGARKAGMPDHSLFHFSFVQNAGRFLQGRMRPGDVVLVKGSQNMRMEKIVKEIMAEPQKAKELLVRQEEKWEAL